ncbi:MAG TPA: ferritin-like domain-containing protein [Gaiellaceae bacterium]
MQLNTLQDVLMEQIADLYSAETQLVAALPKMVSAAHSEELREAFQNHLEETRGHVTRLDETLAELSARPAVEVCEAMKGLLKEGEEIMGAHGEPAALDAALIAAAQRVEHYEIAAYGTARAIAGELGFDRAASLLGETLDEEANADKLLTKIASGGLMRSGINQEATTR